MKIHPAEELLRELVASLRESIEEPPLKALAHSLRCADCAGRLHAMLCPRPSPLARAVAYLFRRPAPVYAEAFAESAAASHEHQEALRQERLLADDLFAELMAKPPERREMLVRNSARFQTWGLFERLVERSREQSFADAGEAEGMATLALRLAEGLDGERYGEHRIADYRARAWTALGNARRLRSDLEGAETAFEEARRHLLQGTRDSLERALFLDLKASLLADQRQFDSAFALLRRALTIYLEVEDRHRAGRVLVQMDAFHLRMGDPEAGIPLLYQAVELIDPAEEPRLLLCAKHNLIFDLAEAGRFLEAHKLYAEARGLYLQFPDSWAQNRRLWVEGKIARGLGRHAEAEAALVAARDGFLAADVPYDVALASLELASLYAEQGRAAELRELAREMAPIFASRQIHREALAALAFFRQAVEMETASLELVSCVARYLKRAAHQPELAFELPEA